MAQVSIVTIPGLDAAVAAHVANGASATAGALADDFVPIPAGIADGQVPVYQASSGTFIPGAGGGGGGPVAAADITDATATGVALMTAANAAAARTTIGADDGLDVLKVRRYNGSSWPVRGTLPSGAAVIWIGPALPLTGGSYAVDGDLAAVIS